MEEALQIGHISVSEMSEYRIISEDATIVWACRRRTQEDLDRLRAQLDKMAACVNNSLAYIAMDPEFHGMLAAAGKNTVSVVMSQTLSSINQDFMRTKIASMDEQSQRDMFQKVHEMHEAIYEAVKAQDEQLACAAMEHHLVAFEMDLK